MSITREEERRRRLRQLAAKIKDEHPCSLQLVVGWGCIKWGCRAERLREYLKVMEYAGLIEVIPEEDRISWIGK